MNSNFTDIRTAFNNLVTGAETIQVDIITESTGGTGVTVDGVLLKDNYVLPAGAGMAIIADPAMANGLLFDQQVTDNNGAIAVRPNGTATWARLRLYNADHDSNYGYGELICAGTEVQINVGNAGSGTAPTLFRINTDLHVDTINEDTAAAGVTIDGLLIQDGSIPEAAVTEHEAALTIAVGQITGTLPVANGGTGLTTFTSTGRLLVSTGATSLGTLDSGASGGLIESNGTTWVRVSGIDAATQIDSGTLPVTRGGIGIASPTSGNLLLGAGGSAMTLLAPGASGGLIESNGSTWVRVAGIDTSQVDSGTFANARIAEGNVTQHEAALTIAETQITDGSVLARLAANETVSGDWNFSSRLFINDTVNTNNARGLTINVGLLNEASQVQHCLTLKSSNISHGVTTAIAGASGSWTTDVEDDDAVMLTIESLSGGAMLWGIMEDGAQRSPLTFVSFGGEASGNFTAKTVTGAALTRFFVAEHNGSNVIQNISADGNVFAVTAWVSGAWRNMFLLDEDGEYYFDGADQGPMDAYDDVELVRALSIATSKGKGIVKNAFDQMLKYGEDTLVEVGLLGAPIAEGGMVCGSMSHRLLWGAAWQQEEKIRNLQSENGSLRDRLARLEDLVDRLLPAGA